MAVVFLRRATAAAILGGASTLAACGLVAGVGDVKLGNDGGADGSSAVPCSKPRGAPMVRVPAKDGDFCIDTRVATVAEFNEFIIADGDPYDTPAGCETRRDPRPVRDDKTDGNLPARGMLWCYAWAFCRWSGKRLCGKIGGGEVPYEPADPRSEWTYACANGKLNYTYPYGSTYQPAACNTEAAVGDPVLSSGSFPNCHGVDEPFRSILDMSGNTPEYDAYIHEGDTVRQRGKGNHDKGDSTCASSDAFSSVWYTNEVTIRCCADP